MNRRVQQYCVWTGPALAVLAGVGLVGFGRLVPANSPSESASRVVHIYTHNLTGVRVGLALCMLAFGLIIPWGCAVATQTRRASPEHPVLFHIQVACSVGGTMLGVMFVICGAVASFRAGHIAPSTTQMLNDAMWLCYVFPGAYFVVWCLAVAAAILLDEREEPVFPRWSGYLCVWFAVLQVPWFLALFFKSGAFSYNGLIVWWVPSFAFFSFVVVMAFLTLRAIAEEGEDRVRSSPAISPEIAAELSRLWAEMDKRPLRNAAIAHASQAPPSTDTPRPTPYTHNHLARDIQEA